MDKIDFQIENRPVRGPLQQMIFLNPMSNLEKSGHKKKQKSYEEMSLEEKINTKIEHSIRKDQLNQKRDQGLLKEPQTRALQFTKPTQSIMKARPTDRTNQVGETQKSKILIAPGKDPPNLPLNFADLGKKNVNASSNSNQTATQFQSQIKF